MDDFKRKQALEVFMKYDINNSGKIELKEYKQLLTDTAEKLNAFIPESNIQLCFDSYDVNSDKHISQEEFIKAFESLLEFEQDEK